MKEIKIKNKVYSCGISEETHTDNMEQLRAIIANHIDSLGDGVTIGGICSVNFKDELITLHPSDIEIDTCENDKLVFTVHKIKGDTVTVSIHKLIKYSHREGDKSVVMDGDWAECANIIYTAW